MPLGENRKLFGSEAPAFFLERSWSGEGISANSDGKLGDEDALGAIADRSFVKEDGVWLPRHQKLETKRSRLAEPTLVSFR